MKEFLEMWEYWDERELYIYIYITDYKDDEDGKHIRGIKTSIRKLTAMDFKKHEVDFTIAELVFFRGYIQLETEDSRANDYIDLYKSIEQKGEWFL